MTAPPPPKSEARERRTQPRQATALRTTVTIDARPVPCQIVNLSPTGALVAAGAAVRLGQVLALDLPGVGAVSCRVQRVTSTHFAVIFDPALPEGIGG